MRKILSSLLFISAVTACAQVQNPGVGIAIVGSTIDSTVIGGTTPAAVHATTLSASGAVSGAGFTAYMASPPAIGGTAPAAVSATVISNKVTTATNTDNRGTIALAAITGLGSYTFTQGPGVAGIWTTAPVCLFFDVTLSTNAIAAVVTNTSISLTGTASDSINYICWPGT